MLRGGDAFALAEALRALPSSPAAILVLAPDLVAISDDAPVAQADRRETDLRAAATAAGAEIEQIAIDDWIAHCGALPARRVRLAGRDARAALTSLDAPWAYDAGRRLALVADGQRRAVSPLRAEATSHPPTSSPACGPRSRRERARSRRDAEHAPRRADLELRLLRLLPACVPDVPADGRGERVAARPHRARRRPAGRRARARRRAPASRPLPRLPRLRAGLPVERAVRRDPRARARGRRRHAHAHRRRDARRRPPPRPDRRVRACRAPVRRAGAGRARRDGARDRPAPEGSPGSAVVPVRRAQPCCAAA